MFFNSHDGFSEAFLRGLLKSILSDSNYNILSNTNNLRDLKTVISNKFIFNFKNYLLGFTRYRLQ